MSHTLPALELSISQRTQDSQQLSKDNQWEYSYIRKVRGKCNDSAEMNLFNCIIKRRK